MPKPFISKSKYLSGFQCPKLIWYQYNRKGEIPEPDAATQAVFDQGHLVGKLAQSLFPGGLNVSPGTFSIPAVTAATREAVKHRKPLFEAGFTHKKAFARVDVLKPVGKDQWDIIEVKSSTEVKEIHLHDLAFQWYTYAGAGLDIRKVHLMHINNKYVRQGEVEAAALLTSEDVTTDVKPLLKEVGPRIAELTSTIGKRKTPDVLIGPHCDDPYACPLKELCWDFLPEHNVLTLTRIGERGFELVARGLSALKDLPRDFRLTAKQQIQVEALRSRTPYVDHEAIGEFLEQLDYPLYYLDFETFMTAIPLYDGVRPYQMIPFQFSLHVQNSPGGKLTHHSFLATGESDPRPHILSRLKELLGTSGSIVGYNVSFERSRLKESCEAYPKYLPWWKKTEPRLVDLLAPFRAFAYYHPSQKGSASIKAVLPALTGKSYKDLLIADGGTASLEYLRVTFGECEPKERERVRRNLETYCALDTKGMVDIVAALKSLGG